MFQLQQAHFFLNAPGIACQAAAGSHHPVAGDDDGDFIVAYRPADCLCRHPGLALFCSQLPCQRAVGRGLAVRDLEQQLPHGPPERRSNGVERWGKIRLPAAEINIQPALCRL